MGFSCGANFGMYQRYLHHAVPGKRFDSLTSHRSTATETHQVCSGCASLASVKFLDK